MKIQFLKDKTLKSTPKYEKPIKACITQTEMPHTFEMIFKQRVIVVNVESEINGTLLR